MRLRVVKPDRSIGVVLKVLFLGLLLLVFAVGALSYVTILNPSFAKSTLEASGVYDNFAHVSVNILTADAEGGEAVATQAAAALTPPFELALTPELLRTNTELVIDGLDGWLRGETERPSFFVDTKAIRSDLNQAVVDYVNERVAALPVCPVGTDYSRYDPFTAGCRPPSQLNQTALLAWADSFTVEIPLLGREHLSDADLVFKGGDNPWGTIPRIYYWGKIALGLFAGLLVLITAVVLIRGRDRSRTLRTLGHACVMPAVVLLLGGAVLAIVLGSVGFRTVSTETLVQADFARETLLPVLQALFRGVGVWMLIFGAIFALLAVAAFVMSRLAKKRAGADSRGADQRAANPRAAHPRAAVRRDT